MCWSILSGSEMADKDREMTDEEFERLKTFILAQQPDEREIESRRKLDRDLDRLERLLKRCVGADPEGANK